MLVLSLASKAIKSPWKCWTWSVCTFMPLVAKLIGLAPLGRIYLATSESGVSFGTLLSNSAMQGWIVVPL